MSEKEDRIQCLNYFSITFLVSFGQRIQDYSTYIYEIVIVKIANITLQNLEKNEKIASELLPNTFTIYLSS